MTRMRCPGCDGAMVEIVISTDGSGITMRSCSTCDQREWGTGDRSIDLSQVIEELAASGATRRHRRAT